MWLSKLKIALVQKDVETLAELVQNLPDLKDEKDIQEAIFLSREASTILQILKEDTAKSMKLIKKNIEFLKAIHVDTNSRLDKTARFDITS